MKRMIIALVAMLTMTFTTASAMSYEQARQQALFLTDKMAYELNLTDDQYEAAYEVNLDYLMGVNNYDDLYGDYWRQRNMDLSYILLDWQYRAFCNASYFYRPLYWDAGYWHFGIYARYPRRDYFFFGRPQFFASYHGGHSWRMNGGRSWYNGRQFGGNHPGGQARMGMRDGFKRGDYGRGQSFGNLSRQSSTRTTVTRNSRGINGVFGNRNNNNGGSIFGGNRSNNNNNTNRSFGNGTGSNSSRSNGSRSNGGTFAPRSSSPSTGSFGSGNHSFGSGNHSFGSGSSNSSRSNGGSFGGGSHSNGGGSNGGGHFGGRR